MKFASNWPFHWNEFHSLRKLLFNYELRSANGQFVCNLLFSNRLIHLLVFMDINTRIIATNWLFKQCFVKFYADPIIVFCPFFRRLLKNLAIPTYFCVIIFVNQNQINLFGFLSFRRQNFALSFWIFFIINIVRKT